MIRSDLALAALASAAVPGMKPVAVAGLALPLDERPDHQRAVVEDATGRRWLIRSPLSPMAGARLARNEELVRQLSRHLPFKVPGPVGRADVGADGYAVVYPHVEGLPLDFTRLPAGAGLANAIGRAVAAVHNIPRGVFEAQDVPVFDAAGSRHRLTALVDRAAETGRVPTGLLARWEEAFSAAPLWQFATTPVHGAFRGGAVLVVFADDDASSGRVVAVTDWEEAMVADPAADLADLYARTSPATWESVLDSYVLARAQRPDPYLHARARLISETNRLGGLAQAVADDDEERTRHIVESLRRMDRLTEDEDSLVPVTARGVDTSAVAVGVLAGQDAPAPDAVQEREWVDDPDDDVTAEVPVVRRPGGDLDEGAADDQTPEGGEPADSAAVVEIHDGDRPAAGTDEEGAESADAGRTDAGDEHLSEDEPDEHLSEDETDAAHTTDGRSEAQDHPAGGVEGEDEAATVGLEDLDDEERLHELYGMPNQPPREDRPPG